MKSKIALCPECGKLISLRFPIHDCRKQKSGHALKKELNAMRQPKRMPRLRVKSVQTARKGESAMAFLRRCK